AADTDRERDATLRCHPWPYLSIRRRRSTLRRLLRCNRRIRGLAGTKPGASRNGVSVWKSCTRAADSACPRCAYGIRLRGAGFAEAAGLSDGAGSTDAERECPSRLHKNLTY